MTASSIRQRSLKSGATTITAQFIQYALNLTSTVVLARLLTPADYGLIAMITAVTGFAAMFKDLGLSMATIQRKEITQEQLSFLFWVNVLCGIVLMIAIQGLAPIIAWFYKDERVTALMLTMSVSFLFTGFGLQHSALLQRHTRFGSLAAGQIFGALCGIFVAISGALAGWGAWALAAQSLTASAIQTFSFWFLSKWRPGPWRLRVGGRSLLEFGLNITGFNVINYFSRHFDNILIGRYCGPSDLGLYSKAYSLLMLPIQNLRSPLNQAAMPFLSRLQDDPVAYRRYFRRLLEILAFLSLPLVTMLILLSEPLILILLGDRWMGVVPIFKILGIASLIQPCMGTARGAVLLTLGKSRKYLQWGAWNAVFVVISFLIGLPWGTLGIARSYSTVCYVIAIPSLFYVLNGTPVRVRDVGLSMWRSGLASLMMVAAFLPLSERLPQTPVLHIISSGLLCSSVYLAAWLILPGGRRHLKRTAEDALLLFHKEKKEKNRECV